MQNPIFILRISDKYCILEQNLVCYKIELKNCNILLQFYIVQMEVKYEENMGTPKLQEQNDCVVYSRYANCGSGFLFSDYTAF